jgi:hypothetical protein
MTGKLRPIETCDRPGTKEKNSTSPIEVASIILAMLSVLGHLNRPSLVTLLLLLNVVGSSPARRAKADGDRPCALANPSIAPQMSVCLNMGT